MNAMKTFTLRVRSKIWPGHAMDWGMFVVTLFLMPTIYMYEMLTVYSVWKSVPFFYAFIPYGGLFVFINIVANFVGLFVTDTSVPREVMSVTKPDPKWQFCDQCVSYMPPRSWHCKYCKTCILKRDHHCMFGGCCIGHFNYRFFIMYLIYVFLGTFYCVLSDTLFLMDKVDFTSPVSLLKVGFPALAYVLGVETFANECYILLYLINWAAFVFSLVMLIFHVKVALKGQVTHDVTMRSMKYDFGRMQNIVEVMGIQWYIAWAFPLISSPLPRNGLDWDTAEEWANLNLKNIPKRK